MRILLATCGLLGHRAFHASLASGLRIAAPDIELEELPLDRVVNEDAFARWIVRLWGAGRVPWPGAASARLGCERALSLAAARGVEGVLRRRPVAVVHLHTQSIAHDLHRRRWPATVVSFDATAAALRSASAWPEEPRAFDAMHASESRLFRAARRAAGWSAWARGGDAGPCPSAVIVPPGVDTARFTPGPGPRSGVVFVGNDFDRKGGPDLLEAWRMLAEPRPELHLVTNAAGLPPLPPGVHAHRGLGPGDTRLASLLRDAAVFALPTREDCFGIAFLEALASGLPCIGTRVMAVPEILRDGATGLLVPPRDPRALAEALGDLLADDARRAALSQAARADALARFDAVTLARQWAALYAEAAR